VGGIDCPGTADRLSLWRIVSVCVVSRLSAQTSLSVNAVDVFQGDCGVASPVLVQCVEDLLRGETIRVAER